ncbi:hypothetical protein Tco_0083261, partial [Tanacetum coccineum]
VLGNRDGNFDDDVDEEIDIEGPDRHVSDTTERDAIETESIPTAATHPDNGKSIAQEETPMPDPLPKGVGADRAGSSLPPSLFVPTIMLFWTEPRSPWPVVLWHRPTPFVSLSLFMTPIMPFKRVSRLHEEHAQCSEGLAVVRAERDSLTATNVEQALRIKELEQQLKNADEVYSSAVKDLENQLAQKDSALVYAERISGERLSENEGLKAQLAFAQKEKTKAVKELLLTVMKHLLQSH